MQQQAGFVWCTVHVPVVRLIRRGFHGKTLASLALRCLLLRQQYCNAGRGKRMCFQEGRRGASVTLLLWQVWSCMVDAGMYATRTDPMHNLCTWLTGA